MKQLSMRARRNWLWLIAGLIVVLAAFPFDSQVCAVLDVAHDATWKDVAWWCSKFGEGGMIGAIGILFSVLYFMFNRPEVAARIFFVALTSELTGLAATILRLFFGRARPNNHDVPQGFYGLWHDGHWIAGQFKYSSFPSGHAASVAGVAAAAWLINRGWGTVAVIYALAVMWSRIALECHHLSDVLASTVLAIPLVILIKPWLLPFLEKLFLFLHRKARK